MSTTETKKATFQISTWTRGGERFYLGVARWGNQAISTAAYRTYTEARQALGAKAERKGWALAYFDGEIEMTAI